MAVFRVERTKDFTVMSNHHLRNRTLSLKAKGLLSLMLSLPADWDYTLAGLACICKDGMCSIRGTIAELEEHGYLRRRRLRNEKGQLTDIEYTILERPEPTAAPDEADKPLPQPMCENRIQAPQPTFDYQTLAFLTQEKPTSGNQTQLNTYLSSIQESSIHPINPASVQDCSMDRIDEMSSVYRDLIKSNIEYDVLSERHGHERLDEVVELMLEAVLSQRDNIRIAGDEFSREVVKSRLLKLESNHIEYVFECLDGNTTKVRNIKAYLLTSLFNAPATIDSYYRAEVNHDFTGDA